MPGSLQTLFRSLPLGASHDLPDRVSGILQPHKITPTRARSPSLVLFGRKKNALTCRRSKPCRSTRLSHRLPTCGTPAPLISPHPSLLPSCSGFLCRLSFPSLILQFLLMDSYVSTRPLLKRPFLFNKNFCNFCSLILFATECPTNPVHFVFIPTLPCISSISNDKPHWLRYCRCAKLPSISCNNKYLMN